MLDDLTRSDSLLAAFPDAALLLDTTEDRVVALNPRAATLLGVDGDTDQPIRFSAFLGKALATFIVFVEEVEQAVKPHEGVDDAMVIGVPDASFGHIVVALTRMRNDITLEVAGLVTLYNDISARGTLTFI